MDPRMQPLVAGLLRADPPTPSGGVPGRSRLGTPAPSLFPERRVYTQPLSTPPKVYTPTEGIYPRRMKQRAVKMPDELWAAVQDRAKLAGVSTGEWIRQVLTAELGPADPEQVDHSLKALRRLAATTLATPGYRCPMPGCEFTARSPQARCSAHGRLMVPA